MAKRFTQKNYKNGKEIQQLCKDANDLCSEYTFEVADSKEKGLIDLYINGKKQIASNEDYIASFLESFWHFFN